MTRTDYELVARVIAFYAHSITIKDQHLRRAIAVKLARVFKAEHSEFDEAKWFAMCEVERSVHPCLD